MKIAFGPLAAAAALALAAPLTASAALLTFDDLTGIEAFDGPYHGFNFAYLPGPSAGNGGSWFHSDYAEPGGLTLHTSPSTSISTEAAYDINGVPIYGDSLAVTTDMPIVFVGAQFIGLDDVTVKYKLYNAGALVYESDYLDISYNTPTYLATGYGGLINEFRIEAYQGYFAMDDLNYNPVSEPGGYALVLAGFLAMAFTMRRRRPER